MAPASILTAVATRIRDRPVLISPFAGFAERDLVMDSSVLLSIRIMRPIAESDLTISPMSSFAIDLNDAVRIPMATAILTRELILIPVEKEIKEL